MSIARTRVTRTARPPSPTKLRIVRERRPACRTAAPGDAARRRRRRAARPDPAPATVDYANLDHAASTPALRAVKARRRRAPREPTPRSTAAPASLRVTSAWYEQARDEVAALRRRPRGRPRRLHPQHHRLGQPARPRLPRDTDGVRLRAPSTTRRCCPGAARDTGAALPGAPRAPRTRSRPLARRARRHRPPRHRPGRRRRRLQRHRRAVAASSDSLAVAQRARRPGRSSTPRSSRRTGPSTSPRSDVDYVAFSGHKLYAPYGAGVLAGRSDWLDAGAPYLRGGGATRAGHRPTASRGPPAPARHEAGSPNVIGAIALAAACATISRAPRGDRGARGRAGRAAARRACDVIDGRRHLLDLRRRPRPRRRRWRSPSSGSTPRSCRRPCRPSTASACATASSARTSSSTRCSRTRGATRPAPRCGSASGLANTAEHVERLVAAVAELAANGPARRYTRTDEGWVADGDERDLALPLPW